MTRLARLSLIVGVIVFATSILAYLYSYFIQRGDHALFLAGSQTPAESAASRLHGTTQVDSIQLVNVSARAVKLWHVQFVGYKGMRVSNWRIKGQLLDGQEIFPNHGDGKLTNVTFNVHISSTTIHDPQSILVTYSYWGIKHTQRLNFSLPS